MKIKLSKEQWENAGKNKGWIKEAQDLSIVKTPDKFTERELTRAIRDAIIAEEGAIKQYESVVDATDNEKAKKVLQSVADEEKIHVGELQKLLSDLLPDEQEKLDKGEKEVEAKNKQSLSKKAQEEEIDISPQLDAQFKTKDIYGGIKIKWDIGGEDGKILESKVFGTNEAEAIDKFNQWVDSSPVANDESYTLTVSYQNGGQSVISRRGNYPKG